jgi:RIO-like serine/threonine protein kinase
MDWTVELVETNTSKLLGKQGPFRPTVRLVVVGDASFVAKDYRACTPLYRWTIGAWNLRRERGALSRLAGLEGVPAIEGEVGRWILVLTHFRGTDLGKARMDRQTPAFFDDLARLVDEMHKRGVVHLDLRQRRNVLVLPGPRPAILDFGSALCLRPGSRLFAWLAEIDRSGVLKYKNRALPGSLTPEEARTLRQATRFRRLWPFS